MSYKYLPMPHWTAARFMAADRPPFIGSVSGCSAPSHLVTHSPSIRRERPHKTPGVPMADPSMATTVRVEGGETLATDGPFVEAKEALGGYFILEADDLDAAIELAAKVPAARYGGAVEVRPMESY